MILGSRQGRSLFFQILALILVTAAASYLVHNTATNLARQGIASGFGFLNKGAGFDIIQHMIPYDEQSTYGRAFAVALLNTLLVSVLGVAFATVLGFAVGIARLSTNFLLSRLALVYVEIVRNVPLLLQLFFWYFAVLRSLPPARDSLHIGNAVFLNMRGLYLPLPVFGPGVQLAWELPELRGFNFVGGLTLIPELVSLLIALTIYTAAFIAEIVRAGLLSVSQGQTEAALALGLTRGQTIRLVVIPQALRVIVPPMTNQYLNLTKNSSLAAAIAYPDLVLVFAGTVLMQTGQAVEVIALTMLFYLGVSLLISFAMNRYGRRVALVER